MNKEALDIIRDLVEELRRHDIQWGSKAYSHAVQFLRKAETETQK